MSERGLGGEKIEVSRERSREMNNTCLKRQSNQGRSLIPLVGKFRP